MEQNKYKLPIIFLVIGLVVGFLVGYLLIGKGLGPKSSETKQLEDLVALTFPKPAEDLRTVMGVVTKVDGSSVEVEIGDPEDYLPHQDGSPQKMIKRVVKVSGDTELYVLRPMQIDESGNISRQTLKIADLKVGERITITSSENIRNAQEFSAVLIEKVEF